MRKSAQSGSERKLLIPRFFLLNEDGSLSMKNSFCKNAVSRKDTAGFNRIWKLSALPSKRNVHASGYQWHSKLQFIA